MLIPDSVLEEIKSHFDIAQFISRYVDLKKAGANHKGLCPFHQEKTPSFMVSSSKGIFKCFGCGVGGNLITFLRDVESISFYEAVRMLAKEAGIDLSRYSSKESEQKKTENEQLYKINDSARAFFQKALKSSEAAQARAYLDKRGLLPEIVSLFSIGFAPVSGGALHKHLASEGFSDTEGLKAGLLLQREDGRIADKFRGRVIFPIINLSGLTCGFTGRVLSDLDNPKYLNSPETPVFQKGKLLFGLFAARDAIRKENCAFVVEGNVDLLTVMQGGVNNVVATSGTAFTETQALLLKRFCEQAVIIYDGDNAGLNAAQRGIPVLINAGLRVRIVALPPEEDPDSYFKKFGREAFLEEVRAAKDVVDFVMDLFERKNDLAVPETKVKLVAELSPFLQAIDEPLLKSEWIRKAALRTGLREDLITAKTQKGQGKAPIASAAAARTAAPDLSPKANELEETILGLLIQDSAKHLPAAQYLSEEDFSNPVCRTLFKAILELKGFDEKLMSTLEDKARETACRLALAVEAPAGTDIQTLILKLRENQIKGRRSELKRRMALPGEDKAQLLAEFNALTREINVLREPEPPAKS
jgi:DNA primase